MPIESRETCQSTGKFAHDPTVQTQKQKKLLGIYTHIIRKDYVADAVSHLHLSKEFFVSIQVKVVTTKITTTLIKKAV